MLPVFCFSCTSFALNIKMQTGFVWRASPSHLRVYPSNHRPESGPTHSSTHEYRHNKQTSSSLVKQQSISQINHHRYETSKKQYWKNRFVHERRRWTTSNSRPMRSLRSKHRPIANCVQHISLSIGHLGKARGCKAARGARVLGVALLATYRGLSLGGEEISWNAADKERRNA